MSALTKIGKVIGAFLLFLVLAAAVYLVVVQPWDRQWGATGAEVARALPGDELVSHPNHVTTRAVTVKAPPESIWPWLVQIGYRRGGLYSFDTLDRLAGILDAPIANEVRQEFQDLNPGDEIPMGYGPGWPVSSVEKDKSLVLNIRAEGSHVSWSLDLRPLNARATRLVLRVRSYIKTKPLLSPLLAFLDIAEFPMVHRMLTGIRDRAEGNPPADGRELMELGSWALAILIGLVAAITAFFKRSWFGFFFLSCLSLVAVLFMAFVQPEAWVCVLIALALLIPLIAALGQRRKTKII